MKKTRWLFLTAAVTGVLLMGCARGESSRFSPAKNCVYVSQDGSVSSALIAEFEGETVEEADLRQYLEAAVIRYNKENGGSEAALNSSSTNKKLPAALQSITVKKNVVNAIFDYASIGDLVKFRQTNDNADESNTITNIEVKKMPEADTAGWIADNGFLKADGSKATSEEVKKDAEASMAFVEGGGTVMFSGKVLFITEGAVKEDEYTVTVPEDGRSCVVFK